MKKKIFYIVGIIICNSLFLNPKLLWGGEVHKIISLCQNTSEEKKNPIYLSDNSIKPQNLKKGWMANIYAFTKNDNALSGIPPRIIGTVAMNKSDIYLEDYEKLLKTSLKIMPYWQCKGILYSEKPGRYTFAIDFSSSRFYAELFIGGKLIGKRSFDEESSFITYVDINEKNYYDIELRVAFGANEKGQKVYISPLDGFSWSIKTPSNSTIEPAHTILYIQKNK